MINQYIAVESVAPQNLKVNFHPEKTFEAEYKRFSKEDTKDITDIRVYARENGDRILIAINKDRWGRPIDLNKIPVYLGNYSARLFYQPKTLSHGNEKPAVIVKLQRGEFNPLALQETYRIGDTGVSITPDKISLLSTEGETTDFNAQGSDLSQGDSLYDFNDDQRQICHVLEAKDSTLIITCPIYRKRGYCEYNYKVYGLQNNQITFETDAQNVGMLRDGGTTIGEFVHNEKTISFYIPAPSDHPQPRLPELGQEKVILASSERIDFIKDSFATELHLVKKPQNLITPGYQLF